MVRQAEGGETGGHFPRKRAVHRADDDAYTRRLIALGAGEESQGLRGHHIGFRLHIFREPKIWRGRRRDATGGPWFLGGGKRGRETVPGRRFRGRAFEPLGRTGQFFPRSHPRRGARFVRFHVIEHEFGGGVSGGGGFEQWAQRPFVGAEPHRQQPFAHQW